jgi:UDP-N-acetylglucosamine transferase subunit ALG13
MIFITVGTHTQPFNRLLVEVDNLISKGFIKERVVAQIGYSTYKPKYYEFFNFTSYKKILSLNKKANIVISHAGVGSIIIALKYNKPLIIVPRLKKYNEHTDNHQLQIAKAFENENKAIVVYNIRNLKDAINNAKRFHFKHVHEKNTLVKEISKILAEWEKSFTTF